MIPYEIMHKRLMHANKAAVLHACQQAGVRISKADADAYLCEHCVEGKATQVIGGRPDH